LGDRGKISYPIEEEFLVQNKKEEEFSTQKKRGDEKEGEVVQGGG
jgi:hypothetical protein